MFSDTEVDKFDQFCVAVATLEDVLELTLVSSSRETSTVSNTIKDSYLRIFYTMLHKEFNSKQLLFARDLIDRQMLIQLRPKIGLNVSLLVMYFLSSPQYFVFFFVQRFHFVLECKGLLTPFGCFFLHKTYWTLYLWHVTSICAKNFNVASTLVLHRNFNILELLKSLWFML